MATGILSRSVSRNNGSGSRLLSIGQVAERWGAHPNSLRAWADSGELPCVVLPSGHRRFRLEDCLLYFEGLTPDELAGDVVCGASGIVVYVRVSSESQDKAGSLERQLDRLLTAVSEREGVERDSIQVFKDVASSFGNREGLNRLVDGIIDGKVQKVYCEYADRLSRVPALTRLVEHLAERYGVAIVCLDQEEESPDEMANAMKELLSYTTVISNRINARKSRLVTVKEVGGDALARMIELRQQKVNARKIARILEEEGYRTTKGEVISYNIVRQRLDANGTESVLASTSPGYRKEASAAHFFSWRKAHLVPTGNPDDFVLVTDIANAYAKACDRDGLLSPPHNTTIGVRVNDLPRRHKNIGRGVAGYRLA